RYKRVCSVDGDEVPYSDIAKGYEMSNGEVVILTDDDFEQLPLVTSRMIDVVQFVPLEQVDPILFAKSYYLEPEKTGTKPYVLLRKALEESGKVAVVKLALRTRESLATLRVRDGVFVLETMLWPDEVRRADFGFLDDDIDVRPAELRMANSLIDSLTGDFEPTEFTDAYREALEELIDAKVAGREVVQPTETTADAGPVVDLMSALRASVEAAKKGRASGGASASAKAKSGGRAAKKTAAKPAAAKKTAKPAKRATKTTARHEAKTPVRRSA
ncbi:MAG: Ku protein, partial [Frankia sp.]|nr:Ku protein [Frankia sp.]